MVRAKAATPLQTRTGSKQTVAGRHNDATVLSPRAANVVHSAAISEPVHPTMNEDNHRS